MRTYVGRGAGAFIENQFFAAPKTTFLLICSPWISPKYVQHIINLANKGVQIKLITGNSTINKETIKLLEDFTKPPRDWLGRIPKDWIPPPIDILIVKEHMIHAKIYVMEGYAVVGSANLTESGLWQNAEHIVIFEGEEAEQIVNDFSTLYHLYLQRAEEEVVSEVRGITEKIGEIFQKLKLTLKPTCPQCGARVKRGTKFCPNCGTKIEQ